MATMSTPKPAMVIRDTGRRGNPRRGCDCVQCFGYCITEHSSALRDKAPQRVDRDEPEEAKE